MNKLFLALIAAAALMLVVGCLTNGKIDWDIFVKPNLEQVQE